MTVELKLTFSSFEEAAAFLMRGNAQVPVAVSTPKAAKETKSNAKTEAPAASQPPAEAAPSPAPVSAPEPSPAPAPAPAAKAEPITYEKTGIAEKINAYLGSKTEGDYASRRAAMVSLLAEFNVKSGKELKAEQYDSFKARIDALGA